MSALLTYIHFVFIRGLVTACTGSFVYFTPKMKGADGEFPFYYFFILFIVDAIEKVSQELNRILRSMFHVNHLILNFGNANN